MTDPVDAIFLGATSDGKVAERLVLKRANRHGLIAGATGTGKTISLQGMVEGLSAAGVPTFVADVKGDLAGLALPGSPDGKLHGVFAERAAAVGEADWAYSGFPVQFWDLFGTAGHPVRTTVAEMGPLLLARLMDLNEVQEGVLTIAFHVAERDGLLLLDLDDLQAMLGHVGERAGELTLEFGNVSKASVGAIQRSLLQLRAQGGGHFFGEPALAIGDFFGFDERGRGLVNILAADRLMASPRLYSTFLLWLLSELFEELPEIGDPDKPKLVFFFDEAHLLFEDAPKALRDKIEQVVRLIRSKGVGVYFVTQNPIDIPDDVAGQLGNRVQHALRAFTPRDQAAVKSAADTFRPNPGLDVASAITELRVGEALVSTLLPDGSPQPVERVLMKPPRSRAGPLDEAERRVILAADAIGDRYDVLLDRHSAEEILKAKADEAAAMAAAEQARTEAEKAEALAAKQRAAEEREAAKARAAEERERARPSATDRMIQSASRSMASSIGRQLGNALLRGLLGGMRRGR